MRDGGGFDLLGRLLAAAASSGPEIPPLLGWASGPFLCSAKNRKEVRECAP